MRGLILVVILIGFIIYRTPGPLRNIYPSSYIVDTFNRCTNETDNFNAPTTYLIRTSGNITVELLDNDNYLIMKQGKDYDSIQRYYLEPMIRYSINLTKHYHRINGTCHVITRNDHGHNIVTKWKYLYPPFWKHVIYIIAKDSDR